MNCAPQRYDRKCVHCCQHFHGEWCNIAAGITAGYGWRMRLPLPLLSSIRGQGIRVFRRQGVQSTIIYAKPCCSIFLNYQNNGGCPRAITGLNLSPLQHFLHTCLFFSESGWGQPPWAASDWPGVCHNDIMLNGLSPASNWLPRRRKNVSVTKQQVS